MKTFTCWDGKLSYIPVIEDMIGKVFTKVLSNGEELVFENDFEKFVFLHHQSCCESVYIESVVGDLTDLENTPIVKAEEVSSEGIVALDECDDSFTWTFYKFATIKGYVDVRWYGSSNGYYSESVDLEYSKKEDSTETDTALETVDEVHTLYSMNTELGVVK